MQWTRGRSPSLLFAVVAAMLVAEPVLGQGSSSSELPAEQSIARAIPYLERDGQSWIDQRGCVSCHQVPFMLWSLQAAHDAGFEVDSKRLRDWQQWATEVQNFVKPDRKADVDAEEAMSRNIDTMNGLLLAIPSSDQNSDWRDSFTSSLISNQRADGTWQACGQLPVQKRPADETTQVTVMWSLLSLEREGANRHSKSSALDNINNDQPVSTEWFVARLLLASEMSEDVKPHRERLISRQHDDGGWGWLSDESSDALATGMALYALQKTGETTSDVIDAATDFLVKTQRTDGSWAVPGTKKSTRGKSTPTSNYWGSAWAVIGLLE